MSTDEVIGVPENLADELAQHLASTITDSHLKALLEVDHDYRVDPRPLKQLLIQGYGYAEIPKLKHALVVINYDNQLQVYFGRIRAVLHGNRSGQNIYCRSKVELPNLDWVDLYYGHHKTLIYNKHNSSGASDEPTPPPTSVVIHLGGDLGARDFIEEWQGVRASIDTEGSDWAGVRSARSAPQD